MPIGITNVQGFSDLRLENLSTASTVVDMSTIESGGQGALNVWNGNAGASRILLGQPVAGVLLRFFITDDAVSSATKFISSGDFDIYFAELTAVQTTAKAVAFGSTLEGGKYISFYALSDVRWAVYQADQTSLSDGSIQSTST